MTIPVIPACVLGTTAFIAALSAGHASRAVRDYLRFGAALYGSAAAAALFAAAAGGDTWQLCAGNVALMVTSLAPAVLALAVFARLGYRQGDFIGTLWLLGCCAAGAIAAATGAALLAVPGVLLSLVATAVLAFACRRREMGVSVHALGASAALLAATAALIANGSGSGISFALFSAAGLTGFAFAGAQPLKSAVEQPPPARRARRGVGAPR
jgi:hypothetical protein